MAACATNPLAKFPMKNRRRAPRRPYSLYAEVESLAGRRDVSWTAEVRAISEESCEMLLGRTYPQGALLNVTIFGRCNPLLPLGCTAKVRSATPGKEAGVWVLGVDFATPLTTEAVIGLLGSVLTEATRQASGEGTIP